jgi:5-hydroxyisourate hydrolase-like protein (transthyretin family)
LPVKEALMSPAFFLLLLSLLTVPQAKQPAAQAAIEGASIEGRVMRAGSDEPLKKAWLTLRKVEGERKPYSTSSDASGRFLFQNVEAGKYQLWVERTGYVHQAYGQRSTEPFSRGTTLTVAPGQKLTGIDFRLIPAAVITGRITDEDGEPLANSSVEVMRFAYRDGKRDLVPAGGGNSNDRGEYRIFGLAPGQYFVGATFQQGWSGAAYAREAGQKGEEAYPPVYYPGTSDISRASPVEVRAGEEVQGIDITFMPTRSVRVTGRVMNAVTGQPGQGTNLMLLPRSGGPRRFILHVNTYVEDEQGNFELVGVTPGSYDLEAHWWDGEKHYRARVPIEAATTDVEGVNIVIRPGAQIPGRVRLEGETKKLPPDVNVVLEQPEELQMFGVDVARVKPEGDFVLANVSDGDYQLRVWGFPEDYYLKSARVAGDDVLEEGLKVASGTAGGPLEIVMSSQGGRVEGAVLKDGLPFSGAHVVLAPEASRRSQTRLFKAATSDQYGHFELRGIAPGDYKLFAWEELESGAYQDPEFLKRYEEQGQPLHVEENARLPAQLNLIPAEAKAP